VLSWGSFPPELSPLRFRVRSLASTHAGNTRLHATCVSGRPAIAVAFRDLDSDAWAREPRIRRYAGSREPHASPSGSDPAHRGPREPSRAPAASPILTPCRACSDGASCPCPLSAAPRASLPFTAVSPRRGPGRWTSKTLVVRTVHQSRPLRGELATGPLAEPDLVPRRRVDLGAADFRQPHRLGDPLLREEQISGGPPCRQVGRLSWAFVPRRVRLEVRACERCRAYSRFGSDPFEPE